MIYLVAMQNGGTTVNSHDPPSVEALNAWVDELEFTATHLLLDPKWEVIERYWAANPGKSYSEAVTAIIDRGMKIRHVGGTYDVNHKMNLEIIQQLLAE